jgi:AmmeMemoRadiSam system protein B/AmmeMemoRadiSam system protein A
MTRTRPPAVAGLFYPADPAELRRQIERYLSEADGNGPVPKAVIAPHAGYVYSGPVAASAYARLRRAQGVIQRVVLVGPAHRVPLEGLATTSAPAFETPLGTIPIDQGAVEAALALPQVQVLDSAHASEHSLEVHLPFLQVVLGEFRLVPFVVGEATPHQVAEVLDLLWGGPETLIVVSSDLSHFHDAATARRIDRETARAIESLQEDQLSGRRACGYLPVGGLLEHARTRGLCVKAIDLRNSGDTAGDPARVVGYGAFVVTVDAPAPTDESRLLHVAARAIAEGCRETELGPWLPDAEQHPPPLRELRATFVTLHHHGALRGCRGSLAANEPLVVNVARSAAAAAFADYRFPPVTAAELADLHIHISILSPFEAITFASEAELLSQLQPGIHGVLLRHESQQGVFLPSVWEKVPSPREFLEHLKLKAGLAADFWSSELRAERFTVESLESDLPEAIGAPGDPVPI